MKKDNWLNFFRFPVFIVAFFVIFDQVTKIVISDKLEVNRDSIPVIDGFFSIVHTKNPGAAWGIFGDHTNILAFISLIAAVGMIVFFRKLAEEKAIQAAGLSLIIGGTIGNMIDRFYLSHVTDFLSFTFGTYQFPAFNVADSAITVGVVIYAFGSLNLLKRKELCEENSSDYSSES